MELRKFTMGLRRFTARNCYPFLSIPVPLAGKLASTAIHRADRGTRSPELVPDVNVPNDVDVADHGANHVNDGVPLEGN
jgi:hypothetical protein